MVGFYCLNLARIIIQRSFGKLSSPAGLSQFPPTFHIGQSTHITHTLSSTYMAVRTECAESLVGCSQLRGTHVYRGVLPHIITDILEESILDRAQSNGLSKAGSVLHKLHLKTFPTSSTQPPRSLHRRSGFLHSTHLHYLVVETPQCSGTHNNEGEGSSGSV